MTERERDDLTLLPDRLLLPRGRAALPHDQVARSQRGRIMQAIVEQVAERGYLATSIQDVITRARVSRKAFYDLFEDKQDAFAAAHLVASQQLLSLVVTAVGPLPESDWRGRMRAGIDAYLGGFVSAPAYATAFMVELLAAGPRLLDQRDQVLERHARGIAAVARLAADEDPGRTAPSWEVILGLAGAADELVTREVRAGRVAGLAALAEPIEQLQLAVFTAARKEPQS